jgi:predicted ATP-dependent endonuclease of OLD family
VTENDLSRIDDSEKCELVKNILLDEQGYGQVLGICRRATKDGEIATNKQLLKFLPSGEHYSKENFIEKRDEYWKKQREDDDFTGTDYRDAMIEEFEPVAEHVQEGKKKNKGDWEDAYDEYIATRPKELDFTLQPDDFPSGTETIIYDELLPRVISIPAIKEVESTTKRGGELGTVIDLLTKELQDELDEEIADRLDGYDPTSDERIKKVEDTISGHMRDTFRNQSVSLEFPELSTEYLFKNVDIKIQEQNLDALSKENVGEGVKRTLIFSLVRTIADIREGQVALNEDEDSSSQRPLLFLYEEADLFLHPALQTTLLRTLEELVDTNTQVLFSTHSPVLVEHEVLDTINMVKTNESGETTVTQFHEILDAEERADQSRLTDLKSVSSYIFADSVVLVEGVTDRIVLKKLTRRLNESWDFDRSSVALLDAGGKGEVCRFYRFLRELGIETYAVFDIDAVSPGQNRDGTSEIESIIDDGSTLTEIEELIGQVWDQYDGPQYSSASLRRQPWEDAFQDLEDLKERIEEGDTPTPDDADLIEKVLNKCEQSVPGKSLWTSETVSEKRKEVVDKLLDKNLLLLNGELEDYYPSEGKGKREDALQFDPEDHEPDELRSRFSEVESRDSTDVEEFFKLIFSNE